MAKLFDADGNEIEAFTAEEVEAKKKEALEAYAKENGKEAELAAAQAKVADLEKQLADAGTPDGQKARLKADKDAAEAALKATEDKLMGEIRTLQGSIFGGFKKRGLDAVSKDAETRTKIEARVESLMKTGEYTQDEAGIALAISDAATLVNGSRPQQGFMDGIGGAGDRGNNQKFTQGQPETATSAASRKLLGITDEDVTKFGPKN